MGAQLIDGKKVASEIQENLKKEISELKKKGINPSLAVIFDGAEPRAEKYVALKRKVGKEIGVNIFSYNVQELTTQKEFVRFIDRLNANQTINGIFVQLPLAGFDEKEIINRIVPEKDIDGCHDKTSFIPCISYGVIKMFETYGINLDGKHAVIIENSQMGNNEKSLTSLLSKENAIVSTCSGKESNLKGKCLKADILCVAAGRAKTITADMVKEGAIVIDMGMNVTPTGRVVGDVDFNAVKEKVAYITPVPGGTGPMTIAMLMYNMVLAAKMQFKIL